jgi:hypothetical protein
MYYNLKSRKKPVSFYRSIKIIRKQNNLMMITVNSRTIEKQVEDFLDNSFSNEDYFINSEIQKKRFNLLSRLVADLFNCKNSAVCIHNISNLIVLILNIYNEKFPVDIYSNGRTDSIKNNNGNIKRIIKENLV